jgi:hypothetical protein
MSFVRKWVDKDIILDNMNNLDDLLKADAFIYDKWSICFLKNLNENEKFAKILFNIKTNNIKSEDIKELYKEYEINSIKIITERLIERFN